MKTSLVTDHAIAFTLVRSLLVVLIFSACTDPSIMPQRPAELSNFSDEDLRESSQSKKFCRPDERLHYNLNVVLRGKKSAHGFIKFRQYENETQLIHLDTWVKGLQPNTTYLLQRAVDTTLDNNCTSAVWLTLGKGLEPQSILTDRKGSGSAELFRSVATIPVGSTFDIHFQIVKESTMEVVLTSDCYQYTVK